VVAETAKAGCGLAMETKGGTLIELDDGRMEQLWVAVGAALTIWCLMAVALARWERFRAPWVALVTLAALVSGWLAWGAARGRRTASAEGDTPSAPVGAESCAGWWDAGLTLFLLLVGAALFFWPTEHLAPLGDSSIYPNTAAMLQRTGGLTCRDGPLVDLTAEQRRLFYVPADEQLPDVRIQSYEGLLYGAYYLTGADADVVVSSRPPLATVCMAALEMLLGDRGWLYAAPLFGTLSLVALYWVGRRAFGRVAGCMAAVWLALSFPQLHFSRAPYAEVIGQFFVWTALYGWIAYLRTRQRWRLMLGVAAWSAAFAARADVILAGGAFCVLVVVLALRRDRLGLSVATGSLLLGVLYSLGTMNWPYLGATAEILLAGRLARLEPLLCSSGVLAVAGTVLVVVLLVRIVRRWPPSPLWYRMRWIVAAAAVGGLVYGLYVRPSYPEYVPLNGVLFATHSEELVAMAARYTSPLLFWLALVGGLVILFGGAPSAEQWLVLALTAVFSLAFFWKYTTASVYPVALRRWVPEVFPGLTLLGAYVVQVVVGSRKMRIIGWVAAAAMAGLLVQTSLQYWRYREASGTIEFVAELANSVPEDAVVVFEPLEKDSVVGWFALPLWSLYQRQALLLNPGMTDEEAMQTCLTSWQRAGRSVYVVAQQDPSAWWPGPFSGSREDTLVWDSSVIGQSRRFPPYVWRFDYAFLLFRWTGAGFTDKESET
jgi:hypothetical protein